MARADVLVCVLLAGLWGCHPHEARVVDTTPDQRPDEIPAVTPEQFHLAAEAVPGQTGQGMTFRLVVTNHGPEPVQVSTCNYEAVIKPTRQVPGGRWGGPLQASVGRDPLSSVFLLIDVKKGEPAPPNSDNTAYTITVEDKTAPSAEFFGEAEAKLVLYVKRLRAPNSCGVTRVELHAPITIVTPGSSCGNQESGNEPAVLQGH